MSTIQFRRGTDAEATSNNPTLALGEPGYTEEGTFKIGDGTTAWNDLDAIPIGAYATELIVPPAAARAFSTASWSPANLAVGMRFHLPVAKTYRYGLFQVDTQAGDIQVCVTKMSGSEMLDYAAPVMDSGVIACPAAGRIRYDLGATELEAGEYALWLWASSTSFQTPAVTSYTSDLQARRFVYQTAALGSGITSSGTTGFGGRAVAMALEGDV